MTYRPWLDGVRGIAVLLVVYSHTGFSGAQPGSGLGGLGVAMFFGLSGYLITGLLLDEHAHNGRIRPQAFYVRRMARLLPALVLMLVVCNVLYVATGHTEVLRGSVFALFYVGNYAAIASGAYLPGYEHTWSLAIEEHFYVVWPVLLIFLLRKRPLASLVRWTLLACAAVLAWRCVLVYGVEAHYLLPYHGSVERADALLYGCAAALAVRAGWRPPVWLGWVALAVLALSLTIDDGVLAMTFTLTLTAVASAALAVGLDHGPAPLRRLFSWSPLAWVGLTSYGIYLWHLPLILLAYYVGVPAPVPIAVVAFVLVPAVAAVSYYGLERPVRRQVRQRFGSTGPPQTATTGAEGIAVESGREPLRQRLHRQD